MGLMLLAGCAVGSGRATGIAKDSVSVAGAIVGYQHSIDRSTFRVGSGSQTVNIDGWTKQIGADGVFAVDNVTGCVVALPNATSTIDATPFSNDPNETNARAQSYFIKAGLPADQIGSVVAMASMAGGGQVGGSVQAPALTSYTSVIYRVVSGVSVPDSSAWVQLNSEGNAVSEGVYWPPLPEAAVAEALAMASARGSGADDTLIAKMGAVDAGVEVVLRHTPSMARVSFAAYGSFDVYPLSWPRPGEQIRHFDKFAVELPPQDFGPAFIDVPGRRSR